MAHSRHKTLGPYSTRPFETLTVLHVISPGTAWSLLAQLGVESEKVCPSLVQGHTVAEGLFTFINPFPSQNDPVMGTSIIHYLLAGGQALG